MAWYSTARGRMDNYRFLCKQIYFFIDVIQFFVCHGCILLKRTTYLVYCWPLSKCIFFLSTVNVRSTFKKWTSVDSENYNSRLELVEFETTNWSRYWDKKIKAAKKLVLNQFDRTSVVKASIMIEINFPNNEHAWARFFTGFSAEHSAPG